MQPKWVMMFSLIRGAARAAAPIAVLVGTCAGNVCIARADIQQTEPFYKVVARADAELRCREGSISYVVAKLKPGQVLMGDGAGEGWVRVFYPQGLHGVVKANEATYDAQTGQITLSTASRLRALDITAGARGHYWHLMDKNQPAGTTYKVVEVLKRADGAVEGYKIVAPAGARGFIRADAVRDATEAEIAAFKGQPGAEQIAAAAEASAPPEGAEATGQQPAGQEQASAPTGTEGETGTEAAQPVTPIAIVEPPPPSDAETALIERVEALAAVFADVQAQPISKAEVDPAIAEFEKAISEIGEGELEEAMKAQLVSRLELLKLRRDVRAQMAAISESSEALDKETQRVEALVRELSNAGRYVAVGRLTPSTVYDGRRLPLMYRIEVVGAPLSRTIAYIKPKADDDFAPMLGRVVGVVGTIETDEGTNVKVVRHTAIDLIEKAEPMAAEKPTSE